jgi:hypothetical protein
MKNLKTILIFSIFGTILFSCSIEKRVHNKGYYVQWNSSKSFLKTKPNTQSIASEVSKESITEKQRKSHI